MNSLPTTPSVELQSIAADRDWVGRAQHGDSEAFNALVVAHRQSVLRHCRHKYLSPEEAEDVTQEVFLNVFRNLGSYQHQQRFSTWLYRVTENACIDQLRKRNRREKHFLPLATDEDGQDVEFADHRADPQANLELISQREQLAAALAGLPHFLRETFVLKEQQGLSYEEIAARLNCKVGTVKSRLYRARMQMMKVLAPAL